MAHVPHLSNSDWIRAAVAALGERANPDSAAALESLRDRLVPLAFRDDRPRIENFAGDGDSGRFRRHPLPIASGCSALVMYWPAGYATLPHDHAGLAGIELVIDGALQVDEFVRVGDGAQLALARSLYLGIGDAAVFAGDAYIHRCRNLSTTRAALSLHVYGGALDAYQAFLVDTAGRYRARAETARSDAPLG